MDEPDALIKIRQILSLEEMERRAKLEAEEMEKTNWIVPAKVAAKGIDLVEWLLQIGAWQNSMDQLPDDAAAEASPLLDLINDIVLFDATDLKPSDRIEMSSTMDGYLRRLEAKGFKVAVGCHALSLRLNRGKKPLEISVGYLRICANPPGSFLIPKDTKFSFG